MNLHALLKSRRQAWDVAAQRDSMFYIASTQRDWQAEDFFLSGEALVHKRLDCWMAQIPDAKDGVAIEIGTGIGRLARALASRFKRVIAIDISPNMIHEAKRLNADRPNIEFRVTSGANLGSVPSGSCALCFSALVFQHIPSKEIVRSYLREIGDALESGGMLIMQAYAPPRPRLYNVLHDWLVGKSVWSWLVNLLHPQGADSTVAKAFPGVYLPLEALKRLCHSNGLEFIASDSDEEMLGSYWAYFKKESLAGLPR